MLKENLSENKRKEIESDLRFKVGDAVKIKSKEWYDGMTKNADGDIDLKTIFFYHQMAEYLDRVGVIVDLDYNDADETGYPTYSIDFGDNSEITYQWDDNMIECEVALLNPDQLKPFQSVIVHTKTGRRYIYCGSHLYKDDSRQWRKIITYWGIAKDGYCRFFSRNEKDFQMNFFPDASCVSSKSDGLLDYLSIKLLCKMMVTSVLEKVEDSLKC